jgi:sec-independent protein translocase protein TatA
MLGSTIGPTEILIILGIILLIFGSTQLPKLARSMGQAQKEFKKGVSEGATDDDEEEKPAK